MTQFGLGLDSSCGSGYDSYTIDYQDFRRSYTTFGDDYDCFLYNYNRFNGENLNFNNDYHSYSDTYDSFGQEYLNYSPCYERYEIGLNQYQNFFNDYSQNSELFNPNTNLRNDAFFEKYYETSTRFNNNDGIEMVDLSNFGIENANASISEGNTVNNISQSGLETPIIANNQRNDVNTVDFNNSIVDESLRLWNDYVLKPTEPAFFTAFDYWGAKIEEGMDNTLIFWKPILNEMYANTVEYWYYTDQGLNDFNLVANELIEMACDDYDWNGQYFGFRDLEANGSSFKNLGFDVDPFDISDYIPDVIGLTAGYSDTRNGIKQGVSTAFLIDINGNLGIVTTMEAGPGIGKTGGLFVNGVVSSTTDESAKIFDYGGYACSLSGSIPIGRFGVTGAASYLISDTNSLDDPLLFYETGFSPLTWGKGTEVGLTISHSDVYSINLINELNNVFDYNPKPWIYLLL